MWDIWTMWHLVLLVLCPIFRIRAHTVLNSLHLLIVHLQSFVPSFVQASACVYFFSLPSFFLSCFLSCLLACFVSLFRYLSRNLLHCLILWLVCMHVIVLMPVANHGSDAFQIFQVSAMISRPNLLAVNGARHACDSHAATFCQFQFLPNLASESWCIWSLESSMQPGLIIIDNPARLGKEHQCRSLDHFSLRWLDWSVANEISQDAYWADARVDDSLFGFHTEGKLRNIYCNSTTIPLVTTNAFQACWRKASWMSTTRLISLFLNSTW